MPNKNMLTIASFVFKGIVYVIFFFSEGKLHNNSIIH